MEHSITIFAESMNEVQVKITSKSHFMNAYLREESDFTSTFKKPCVTVPLLPEQCSVNIPNRNHFEPRSALMDQIQIADLPAVFFQLCHGTQMKGIKGFRTKTIKMQQ